MKARTRCALVVAVMVTAALSSSAQAARKGRPARHMNTPASRSALPVARQKAEARRQFQLGERLFRGGRYEQAVRAYKAGYELTQLPGFLINIAGAYARMGELERARGYYEEFLLKEPAPTPRRQQVMAALEALDQKLSPLRRPPPRVRPEDATPAGDPDGPVMLLSERESSSDDASGPVTVATATPTTGLSLGLGRAPDPAPELMEPSLDLREPAPAPMSTGAKIMWGTAVATSVLAVGIAVWAATHDNRVSEGSIGTLRP